MSTVEDRVSRERETLLSKIIIGIHGLGNKPPRDILQNWWEKSISEGFDLSSKKCSLCTFEMVYWANHIHSESLQPSVTDPENPLFIAEPYVPRGEPIVPEPRTNRKKILDYIEKQLDKLLLNEDLSINFSAITDYIIHRYFRDLEIYYTSEHADASSNMPVRIAIQNELKSTLLKYKNHDILLLAHSMGTIIAYEVLQQLKDDVNIHTFVSCGSPLGIPVVMSKIFGHLKENDSSMEKLTVPENIRYKWYNLSDLEDRVAMNYNLADDYPANSKGLHVEDIEVFNDYAQNGTRNPHKSYGYLRTPEMAGILSGFIESGKSNMRLWLENQYNQLFRLISAFKVFSFLKKRV